MTRLSFLLALSFSCAAPSRLEPLISSYVDPALDAGFRTVQEDGTGETVWWAKDNIPLILMFDQTARPWAATFRVAAEAWNTVLGFNAFIPMPCCTERLSAVLKSGQTKSVIAILSAPVPINQATTYFQAVETGEIGSAALLMPGGRFTGGTAFLMASHELGHLLGLAHDPELPTSIMFPQLDFDGFNLPRFPTVGDIARIQARYR